MKRLSVFLLFLAASAFGQTVASRRYNEPSPQGMYFRSLTAVAPYNEADGYTLVPDNQIQWPDTISDDNTFTSTSNFTVVKQTDVSTTFTVASNVGTITTGTAANAIFSVSSNGSGFSVPSNFVEVEVDQNGAAVNPDQATLFLTNSAGTNSVGVTVDAFNSVAFLEVNGTQIGSNVSFSVPTAPWKLGISITGAFLTAWSNSGSGWSSILSADVTASTPSYDIQLPANLASIKSGLQILSSSSVTWQFSSLKTSLYGGTGVRDIHLVIYPDGRPYMRGSTAYFLATLGAPASSLTGSTNGIFSFDPTTNTLNLISTIGSNRSSHTYTDQAGDVIYDPATDTERIVISTWGSTNSGTSVESVYAAQSISTDDWLAAGPHVTPAMTQLSLPNMASNNPYDPYLACETYNYSSNSCSLWLIAYSAATTGGAYMGSSTSDPSANSWTAVLDTTPSIAPLEGSTIIRTASGSGGSQLTACWSGDRIYSATARTSICYDQTGTLLGNLWAMWPTDTLNIPHNTILKYGNTAYYVTFNNNAYVSGGGISTGNWLVSNSPRYPTFIYDGGCAANSTSCTVTAKAFDWAAVACRNGTGGVTMTASSTPSNTFTANPSGSNNVNPTDELFYSGLFQAGSTTFTCGFSPGGNFQGIAVNLYRRNNNTGPAVVASQVSQGNPSGVSPYVYTTPSFSTSGYGLVLAMGDQLALPATMSSGPVGGITGYMRQQGGAFGLEDMYFPTNQSGITAAMSTGTNAFYGSGVMVMSATGQAAPSFSPPAGTYSGTQSVTITPSLAGATVCYTTDGSTPTANGAGTCTHGTTYSGPVSVATSETVRAVESLAGYDDSAVSSAAYTIQNFAYATGCSSSSGFSCTATATAGQLAVAFCATASNGTLSITDSQSNSWTALAGVADGDFTRTFYSLSVAGGSTTFTCGNTGGSGFPGILVVLYSTNGTRTFDTSVSATGTGTTLTSPSFTTTAADLTLLCAHPTGGGPSVVAGSIGGTTATMRNNTSGGTPAMGCEEVIFGSAQTGITASMTTNNSSAGWAGTVVAFK